MSPEKMGDFIFDCDVKDSEESDRTRNFGPNDLERRAELAEAFHILASLATIPL